MKQYSDRKKALVLSGGGTKGIYQCGAIRALKEIGRDQWDIITGTSVGALNAAMMVQGDLDAMEEMYANLKPENIVNGYVPKDLSLTGLIKDRRNVLPALGEYLKNEGLDISPLRELVDRYYDPERFFASGIDFGCICARRQNNEPVYVTKEQMKEDGRQWLVASAAAYPVFPVQVIGGEEYVDGGYADNCPIDFAMQLGAEEVTAIEMHDHVLHRGYLGREHVTIIHPRHELFGLLEFDRERLEWARMLGYLDTLKIFGRLAGVRYAFVPFGLPEAYDRWYLQVMRLEAIARRTGGKRASEESVMDPLRQFSGRASLDYAQMFFAAADCLMTIANLDETRTWRFEEAAGKIRAFFMQDDALTAGAWAAVYGAGDIEEQVRYTLSLMHVGEDPEEQVDITNNAVRFPFQTALADFYLRIFSTQSGCGIMEVS